MRLFVDMDGTLATFTPVDKLETLYEKGYFANLEPHYNVLHAITDISLNATDIEVFILSSYLSDSEYALKEKNEWLDKYLSEIPPENRLFIPCGRDKAEVVPGGLQPTDCLLDDYTQNLLAWEPPARGLKLLNPINHTKGTWGQSRIRYDREYKDLSETISSFVRNKDRMITDERISIDFLDIPPSKIQMVKYEVYKVTELVTLPEGEIYTPDKKPLVYASDELLISVYDDLPTAMDALKTYEGECSVNLVWDEDENVFEVVKYTVEEDIYDGRGLLIHSNGIVAETPFTPYEHLEEECIEP